jgi:hypothetical protein
MTHTGSNRNWSNVLYGATQNFAGATVYFGKIHWERPSDNIALTWSSQEAVMIPKHLTEEVREAK